MRHSSLELDLSSFWLPRRFNCRALSQGDKREREGISFSKWIQPRYFASYRDVSRSNYLIIIPGGGVFGALEFVLLGYANYIAACQMYEVSGLG